MRITIELQPEIQRGLLAQAQAKGISLDDYVQEIVAREVQRMGSDDDVVRPPAELVRDGPFLVISTPLPPGWNPVQAVHDMRAERDQKVLGL